MQLIQGYSWYEKSVNSIRIGRGLTGRNFGWTKGQIKRWAEVDNQKILYRFDQKENWGKRQRIKGIQLRLWEGKYTGNKID